MELEKPLHYEPVPKEITNDNLRMLATEMFPPVSPSINLAKNNISNRRVIAKVPRRDELTLKIFSLGKNNARRKNIQPTKVPALLEVSFFFRKYQTIFPRLVLL
jgi:hypothetical protein